MRKKQLNVRVDNITWALMDALINTGEKQSDIVRNAIFDYAEKKLEKDVLKSVVYKGYKGI